MDIATQLLLTHARSLSAPTLWLADEQIDDAAIVMAARPQLFALSNRCDVVTALSVRGVTATLCDFDIALPPAFEHAIFRVAKEKALVHHIINAALERLPVGGTLALSGYKNEGIKTYIEKAAARAQGELIIEREGGAMLGIITCGEVLNEALPDQHYALPRQFDFGDNFFAWTKPGIFGWQKIDAGSAYLCDHLAQVWPQNKPQRVLDLGCGYGYLTMRAAEQWPQASFVATDNNIAATQICARNMSERAVNGRVECTDCGDSINENFDAILCNPPFHQGFDHEQMLTEKFLRQARRLLARGGCALFVVNQFIGLEKTAQPLFKQVDVIARNKSFKLVALGN